MQPKLPPPSPLGVPLPFGNCTQFKGRGSESDFTKSAICMVWLHFGVVIIYGLLMLFKPLLYIEQNCLCHLIINNIKFGNLLVIISRLYVLDRAC